MLEHCCGDLLPFSHKSISEVGHWCWGDQAWLAVGIPIHPKGVRWGSGQSSVQASQVLPHRSRQTIPVWTSLCARGYCHAETGKGLPQTVPTTLEVLWGGAGLAKKFKDLSKKWKSEEMGARVSWYSLPTAYFANLCVCSKHFIDDDYVRDIQSEFMETKHRRKLKDTTAASVFRWTGSGAVPKTRWFWENKASKRACRGM